MFKNLDAFLYCVAYFKPMFFKSMKSVEAG